MVKIITTLLEKLKISNPSRSEKAGYFLMHDEETKEVSAVPEAAVLAKVNSRIDGIIYPDGFTKTTPINRVGKTVTIAPYDFAWRILLNPYTNADAFTKTLDDTASGELKRIDTLSATTDGTILYYKGEEDEFIVKAPRIPTTELRITDIEIFGDTVQGHTEPFISEVYTLAEKEKLAFLDYTSDIDKPVSADQAAADAEILADSKAYTDAKLSVEYSKIVYVNSNNPSTATIFDLNNPPVANDNVLKTDDDNLYIGLDESSWFYNSLDAIYEAELSPVKSSNFNLYGTNKDAGNNKSNEIERTGPVGVGPATKANHAIPKAQHDLKMDWSIGIRTKSGITDTFAIDDYKFRSIYTNTNPVAVTIPTNAVAAIPIGSKIQFTQQGTGVVTVGGAGITIVTNIALAAVVGETRTLTKIATDTWTLEGDKQDKALAGNVVFVNLQSGNDSTGEYQNFLKPFLTLQAAIDAAPTNKGKIFFRIYGTGTSYITKNLATLFDHDFECLDGANISFQNFSTATYGTYIIPTTTSRSADARKYSFKTTGSLIFGNGTTQCNFSLDSYPNVVIDCGTLEFKTFSALGGIFTISLNTNATLTNANTNTLVSLRFAPTTTETVLNFGNITSTLSGSSLQMYGAVSGYGRLYVSFKSITATTAGNIVFYNSNFTTGGKFKIGNINMPAGVTSGNGMFQNVFDEIDSTEVTSCICGNLGDATYVGGANFSQVTNMSDLGNFTLKNGIFIVKMIARNALPTTPVTTLINVILKAYGNASNCLYVTNGSVVDMAGAIRIRTYGFCKIINANPSGTLNIFDSSWSTKTNVGIYVDGVLQLERVSHTNNVGSLVITNNVTTTL